MRLLSTALCYTLPTPGLQSAAPNGRKRRATGRNPNDAAAHFCLPQLPDHGIRRLPETFIPDDAGLTFAFKEGWREHSELCDRQPDTEGGRQDKSDGMKVDRNRLTLTAQLQELKWRQTRFDGTD